MFRGFTENPEVHFKIRLKHDWRETLENTYGENEAVGVFVVSTTRSLRLNIFRYSQTLAWLAWSLADLITYR